MVSLIVNEMVGSLLVTDPVHPVNVLPPDVDGAVNVTLVPSPTVFV